MLVVLQAEEGRLELTRSLKEFDLYYLAAKIFNLLTDEDLKKGHQGLADLLSENGYSILDRCELHGAGVAELFDEEGSKTAPTDAANLIVRTLGKRDKDLRRPETYVDWKLFFWQLTSGLPFSDQRHMAFFWGLIEGEANFARDFLRFKSHEERLTGALLTCLMMTLRPYGAVFQSFTKIDSPQIIFFDTATDTNEAYTGADVGVIVRSGSPGDPLLKAAKLQIKLSEKGSFEVDRSQLGPLTAQPGLGYYLAIECATADGLLRSPRVIPAKQVAGALSAAQRPTYSSKSMGGQIPLSVFLATGMTDRDSGVGFIIDCDDTDEAGIAEAAAILFDGGRPPRYWMVIDTTLDPMAYKIAFRYGLPKRRRVAQPTPGLSPKGLS